MAKDKNKEQEEVLVDVGQTISKAEKFVEENKQTISGVIIALVVSVGGYFAWSNFYQKPLEAEASEALFFAQRDLEQDSLKAALDGRNGNMGFVEVADEYSSTKAGNLANYYAGIAYLNLGEFKLAIEYLDKFKGNDPIVSVIAKGAIGDAFLELNQPKEALEYYSKAVNGEDNSFVVPIYLQRAAMVAEAEGEFDQAKKFLKRLKVDFKDAEESVNVEKDLARIEAKLNS